MSSWSLEDKEEAHQDAMLKVWQVLSTKLDDKKIKAVLQFLWIVVNNALISVTRQHLRVKKPKIEYMFCEDTPTDDYDEELDIDQDKLREIIYTELDRKIIEQEKVRTNAFYLMQLKQYLENNNCNGEGFQSYILQTMGITKENFYQINYTLGLKSGVFKDKKNKKQKL
jgi:DNA-directed RNA polymerase specialized sigma24 family protein